MKDAIILHSEQCDTCMSNHDKLEAGLITDDEWNELVMQCFRESGADEDEYIPFEFDRYEDELPDFIEVEE